MKIEIVGIVCAIISAITDTITFLMYVYALALYLHKVDRIERHLERIASTSNNEEETEDRYSID